MTNRFVLDSHAVLAYLQDEPGADIVQGLLDRARRGETTVLCSCVNAAEVYWATRRHHGAHLAERAWAALCQLPVTLVPADERVACEAGEIKAGHSLALGDAFAAATARLQDAEVVTGDPEFAALETLVPILWLGEPPTGSPR